MHFIRVFEDGKGKQMKNPLLELVGYNRLLVENHAGIATYSADEIQIKVAYGKLCVNGNNLSFVKLGKEQLIITGCIQSIQICRRQL